MTIQYEVVIWTIINFALLFAVLYFLLFKPMLKVMDERRAKIERGLKRREELSAMALAAEEKRRSDAERSARLAKEKAAAEYEEAAKQCEEQRLSSEAESKMLFSEKCNELTKEEAEINASLKEAMSVLSVAVARKLTEKGL